MKESMEWTREHSLRNGGMEKLRNQRTREIRRITKLGWIV